MPLTEADGTITTSTSEQDLFSITTGGPKYFTVTVFLHNMTATEVFTFRPYLYDTNGAAFRALEPITVSGAQTGREAHYLPTLLSSQFKLTVQRISGTDRAITWKLFEQT